MATAPLRPLPPGPDRPLGDQPSADGHAYPTAWETARARARVLGDSVLVRIHGFLQRLSGTIARALPDHLNPFLHTGPIADATFAVAAVSGILLLLWYVPSVHGAYDSVVAMDTRRWTGGLVRSLHRYSSDACMFFVLLHAVQSVAARRIGGARWVAWVTGIGMTALVWFLGWTGYWLVWDRRGQLVATSTAKLLDVLPIFAHPLGRSFLTNDSVGSLLFFLVFFLHMILPVLMVVGIWLHVMRLRRAAWFPGRALTVWTVVSLCVLAAALPADTGPRADMQAIGGRITIDAWYLLPLLLIERLEAGAIWGVFLVFGVFLFTVPWTIARRRPPAATVVEARCNACQQCYEDCPYQAIRMAPRRDGRTDRSARALVDPALCVSCGICNGSCDTAAIGVPDLPELEVRERLTGWLAAAAARGESPLVALVCGESAAAALRVDPATGLSPDLPGYLVVVAPCAGWFLAHDVERALRRGASGVLVVSCPPGGCLYREGPLWAGERFAGERKPALRLDRLRGARVRMIHLDRTRTRALLKEAVAFAEGRSGAAESRRWPVLVRGLAGLGAGVLLLAFTWAPSAVTHAVPGSDRAVLTVSFKHPGRAEDHCRSLSPEEIANLPRHMRRTEVCERRRAPVRLRVEVDGKLRLERAYPPRGLFGDGSSIAVERISVAPDRHRVRVAIGETHDPGEWSYTDTRELNFEAGRQRVVLFDRSAGFRWY